MTDGAITYGSGCSGIEAASAAWHEFGWEPVWLAEIESSPSDVLAHRLPDVPNLGDFTKIAARIRAGEVEAPDVFVAGTPCQAFSVAGLRNGLSDERGALTLFFVELANAIDDVRRDRGKPECVIVWENVPGVLSSDDNAFGCFLGALCGESGELQPSREKWTHAGCVFGPRRAVAWRTLDAQYFGLAQRRRRVFVVASARQGFNPATVLFEFDGLRRDFAPSREAPQDVAGTITAGAFTGGAGGRVDGAIHGHFQPVANTITGDGRRSGGYSTNDIPLVVFGGGDQSGSLDVAPCQTRHGMRLDFDSEAFVVHGTQDPDVLRDMAHTLGRNSGQGNAIAYSVALRGRDGGATAELGDDVAGCLRASTGGGDKPHVLHQLRVRRLMPVECERLQGFPDNWTLVPVGKKGKPMKDGPRYKAIGNSMAVNCMRWIGNRINEAMI